MQVVGIGASAGGIEAFRSFFQGMPADSGMGFVVVLHLSADRKSMLTEIIARWTGMPVQEVSDNVVVEANNVYVVPPGFVATMQKGRLHLWHLAPDVPRESAPIDEFFDSLATDLGEEAIGIVLSGTGHDGALGLKAIKARGGLTLVQGVSGSTPQHSGMPSSAIATGAVDLIVPVQDMPTVLMGSRPMTEPAQRADMTPQQIEGARLRICDILRSHVGHDFSHYKDKTFLRRVQRRMQVLGVLKLPDYVSLLQGDHGEAVLLFRDLLIGVTTFFRDADAFKAVEEVVVPRLFRGKTSNDHVRVWVPGCATGEEAYSLAILLREHMAGMDDAPTVQVFATDIDDRAIATARAGRYPAGLLDGLAPERRERFFTKSENSYVISKEIRDLCTFSAHSLVRDPPFSRMNLISCRNLLIYMDTDLQATVIPTFHYSLLPGGILLLGSSETITRNDQLFNLLDKAHRIYERRDGPSLLVRVPSALSPQGLQSLPKSHTELPDTSAEGRTNWSRSLAVASSRVLERFASPFVVVSEDGSVVHYSSHVGNVLQPALGPPSRSVFDMARRGLRHGLRATLHRAVQTGRPAEQTLTVERNGGGTENITLVVEPLPGQEPDRPYLIVFLETSRDEPDGAPVPGVRTDSVTTEMERELRDTREQLQSLTEEHDTALEELRSANEELHSVNEELQSSNEELETSKEEIQSVNEELQTVNTQLYSKVDELDRANSDLRNLFESTRVATVFLDRHMVIRAFTPEVATIYNLIPGDRGRPLTDIVNRLQYDSLREDVLQVLKTLEPLERRVSRKDSGAHYLLRILPYRGPDGTVEGSLVTFVDVTRIVEAEQHQRLLVDELNHRVKNMLTLIVSLASQTLQRSGSLKGFSAVFLGRVRALTATYSLIIKEHWSAVELREIIDEELKPYVGSETDSVRVEGPPVALNARSALALGMALHEFKTNAVEYGALSVPEGRVSVTWAVEEEGDDQVLALDWVEQNGPPMKTPQQFGFGTMLIERVLAHDLSGEAKIEFLPGGVRASVRAPLSLLSDASLQPEVP